MTLKRSKCTLAPRQEHLGIAQKKRVGYHHNTIAQQKNETCGITHLYLSIYLYMDIYIWISIYTDIYVDINDINKSQIIEPYDEDPC